jgi:hypothetical protein
MNYRAGRVGQPSQSLQGGEKKIEEPLSGLCKRGKIGGQLLIPLFFPGQSDLNHKKPKKIAGRSRERDFTLHLYGTFTLP